MADIADSFNVPKDLPSLCYWMADLVRGAMKCPDQEMAFISYSCAVQRLEQLGIFRPTTDKLPIGELEIGNLGKDPVD
jgi:hypothetical protein